MRQDKAAQLLYTLLKRTEANKVPWTQTATDGAFEASFPKTSVRIGPEERWDEDEGREYTINVLQLFDQAGKQIDTIEPFEVRESFTNPTAWQVMNLLYQRARDLALGVDDAVSSLLAELGGPEKLPEVADSLDDEIPF